MKVDAGPIKGLSEEKSRELLELLDDVVNLAHELVADSKLAPKSKPIKALSLAILFQLAEKGSGIHYLASAGLPAGLETIARTMFESHVDLQNLHNYPDDYPNYILATGALSQRKQLDDHDQQADRDVQGRFFHGDLNGIMFGIAAEEIVIRFPK